ncbi:hypothetical protein ABI214_08045 [Prescottella soli]|uniref:Uncharacterized protein n=1 Tax=Prescottella soli TaxID=1543852 RepID=A0ABW9FPP0_9NOCA
MTILGAALTLVGFSNHMDALELFGVALLTMGLTVILLGILDVGVRGRRHWF